MRHAKSSWQDAAQPDHDRELNGRGRRAAPFMGELLARQDLLPDFVITSTAVRALDTAKTVIASASYQGPLEITRRLYLAEVSTHYEVLLDVPVGRERVLLVGHNPGISDFLLSLTGEEHDMPTAAIARIDLDLSEFSAIREGIRGKLVNFWRPREEQKGEKKSRG